MTRTTTTTMKWEGRRKGGCSGGPGGPTAGDRQGLVAARAADPGRFLQENPVAFLRSQQQGSLNPVLKAEHRLSIHTLHLPSPENSSQRRPAAVNLPDDTHFHSTGAAAGGPLRSRPASLSVSCICGQACLSVLAQLVLTGTSVKVALQAQR